MHLFTVTRLELSQRQGYLTLVFRHGNPHWGVSTITQYLQSTTGEYWHESIHSLTLDMIPPLNSLEAALHTSHDPSIKMDKTDGTEVYRYRLEKRWWTTRVHQRLAKWASEPMSSCEPDTTVVKRSYVLKKQKRARRRSKILRERCDEKGAVDHDKIVLDNVLQTSILIVQSYIRAVVCNVVEQVTFNHFRKKVIREALHDRSEYLFHIGTEVESLSEKVLTSETCMGLTVTFMTENRYLHEAQKWVIHSRQETRLIM